MSGEHCWTSQQWHPAIALLSGHPNRVNVVLSRAEFSDTLGCAELKVYSALK